MSPQLLAQAVEDNELRDAMVDQMSPEEVVAFEEYISEYQAREYVVKKKDS